MNYNPENIFAKIINGTIAAEKLYEDEILIAIKDIAPAAPVHILVIPKQPYTDFADFTLNADPQIIVHYNQKIAELAYKYSQGNSYRLISNKGQQAGQSVFHFHTHILSGFDKSNLL